MRADRRHFEIRMPQGLGDERDAGPVLDRVAGVGMPEGVWRNPPLIQARPLRRRLHDVGDAPGRDGEHPIIERGVSPERVQAPRDLRRHQHVTRLVAFAENRKLRFAGGGPASP